MLESRETSVKSVPVSSKIRVVEKLTLKTVASVRKRSYNSVVSIADTRGLF